MFPLVFDTFKNPLTLKLTSFYDFYIFSTTFLIAFILISSSNEVII